MAIAAAAAALALPAAASAAPPADPLAVTDQDWLARVVPADLPAPAGEIPPIAIVEDGVWSSHQEMAGGWVRVRRPSPRPPASDEEATEDYLEGVAHGTAVAGVIGAPRNGVGIEGVLPGARVWVYGSTGSCSDIAAAIRQAVRHGARVINMSGGFTAAGACRALHDAVGFAYGQDVLVVASAGNSRPAQPWIQPANDRHVVTVGAATALDQPASFSHQNNFLDLLAPGEGVLTTVPDWYDTDDGAADGYARLDGTSFAAPVVSAVAAWVMAERPALSADQVAQVLRTSAR
ncbi:MAG: S8 family serine peptidase, partial [Actinomycetota bacterium]